MPQRIEGDAHWEVLEEQQRLRDEVQRLRDEQQRMRDEQQKQNDEKDKKQEGDKGKEDEKGKDEKKEDEPKKEEEAKPKKKGFNPVILLIALVVIAALAIGAFFLLGYLDSYEATDDAQVDGHIDPVSSRISGTVSNVFVEDNYPVKAGQVLVQLDPKDYQVALEQAQAELNQAQAELTAQNPNIPIINTQNETTLSTTQLDVVSAQAKVANAQQQYESALANVREAEANHVNDVAEVARFKVLVDKDEVSREQYEAKVTAAKASEATVEAYQAASRGSLKQIDQAQAEVNSAKARVEQARQNAPRQIAVQRATIESRRADVLTKKAAVDQALLNLQYTKINAPADGVVGKKSVEAGTRVSIGQELLAVVPLDDVWITANFKETQLRRMHDGQRVTIQVDAFGGKYEGYIQSIAAASGARYSLLPPENATGNYVKVVQRIPVRIRLNKGQNDDKRLRPGMSVSPKVWLQ